MCILNMSMFALNFQYRVHRLSGISTLLIRRTQQRMDG